MNAHDWKHRASCFKNGKEFSGPFQHQCGENTKFEEYKDYIPYTPIVSLVLVYSFLFFYH
jgi:hypothetical protein